MLKRCRFSKEEELIMKSIVQNESGRTGGKIFWQRIKDSQGILERHSAESLKFHWKLMTKKQNNPKPVKPVKSKKPARKEEKKINNLQKEDETNKEIKDNIIKSKPNDVLFTKYSGYIYTNDSDHEFKMPQMGENEIGRLFERLFEICSKAAGTELDKEVVVMVLDEHQGKVIETIKYFQRMRSIDVA